MNRDNGGASIASSDSDTEMFSTYSSPNGSQAKFRDLGDETILVGNNVRMEQSDIISSTLALAKSETSSLDILDRISQMYRLLDLRNDDGSGGIVDKVVIDQNSVARFANDVRPGSYRSTTQVNFRSLDESTIKPLGVYGSIPALVDFLEKQGMIDQETRTLLLAPRNEDSGVSAPTLRPGIYLLDLTKIKANLYHVLFWPEDATWQDNSVTSVARNRVTFMRYMTKLCDQLVCLISEEHSANLVWKDEPKYVAEDDSKERESFKAYDRLFTFSVQQTNEAEETAVATPGFSIPHSSISCCKVPPTGFPDSESLALLDPQIIVGETAQAILQVEFTPERPKEFNTGVAIWPMQLHSMLSVVESPNIILTDNLDTPSLRICLDNGLWARCGPDFKWNWTMQMKFDDNKRWEEKAEERTQRLAQIEKEIAAMKKSMPFYLVAVTTRLYPILLGLKQQLLASMLGSSGDPFRESDQRSAEHEVASWLEKNAKITGNKSKEIEADLQILETEWKAPYDTLKRRLRRVYQVLEDTPGLRDEDVQRLVDLINLRPSFTAEVAKLIKRSELQRSRGFLATAGALAGALAGAVTERLPKYNSNSPLQRPPPLSYMDDVTFAAFLRNLVSDRPVFTDAALEITKEMTKRLTAKIKKWQSCPSGLQKPLQASIDADVNSRFESRAQREVDASWRALKVRVQEALAAQRRAGAVLTIDHVVSNYNQTFGLNGTLSSLQRASLRYTLRPLEVKQDDVQQIARDKTFICQPIIRPHAQSFSLPLDAKLRYIRLVGKDSCLIILQIGEYLQVYLDQINVLWSVIETNKRKKQIQLEKVGSNCLFALDETKRLLAILSCHSGVIAIYVYMYDMDTKTFNARGGAININKWYTTVPNLPVFAQMVFVAGTEELLLVEASGSCRVFSLVTENFRPSTLDIAETIYTALSSPDGTCLFLVTGIDDGRQTRCFHWASFGSNQGIELDTPRCTPGNSRIAVSSVGHRSVTHLLFLDTEDQSCHSLLVRITSKSSDFTVHSDFNRFSAGGNPKSSINNSLIDCHPEVWTRFPVYGGAIKRETSNAVVHEPRSILFISSALPSNFPQYFASLIREFEAKTRKPTRGSLKQIKISSFQEWPSDLIRGNIATSEIPLGEWLVGMFCLIPLHLAVTSSNRFNPLNDGLSSPEFERSLLGANVIQISQAITFGWYESIFSSYLAKKPVKVVTSMGEQSVGKSFALNHFVDTSFAGSAMRCTEGVWLSVTPTRDYVVVAMDFEGVHSIERSAQEDTLLVLLNAAISNFVLFRNNFAMSRDIAGLFTSFQSSTNVLDTATNASLFNGTLGIIIKDVIDSDTQEIVNEFYQKFQAIVQQEKGDNFLSKLHKGNFDIIPWPVIESADFYELFGALKVRLDSQPLTHRHAGAFIGDLKMLMAQLKANDWGALDLNLAVQRADQLSALLDLALALGTTDSTNRDPLRNFDTDEAIPGQAQGAVFYLETASKAMDSAFSIHSCLAKLRRGFPEYLDRFKLEEEEFFLRLATYLQSLVKSRIGHVAEWLRQNTERFGGKAEIVTLLRVFEGLSKELRASVVLCGSKCSSCGLLCVEHTLHDGKHSCKTSHKCPQLCSFGDQHDISTIPACGMPAGHLGRHVCSGAPHLCDVPCHLRSNDGCLTACSKAIGHDEEEEHICAAKVHACGEPCSLVRPDGTPICTRPCVVDCRRAHRQHACDRSLSCPIKCQLCGSFCAAGNHFHPLEPGAVHLCGQVHACRELCQQPGICEIATTPQSIESTFIGKHATYQYTRYTQEAKRLHCIVPIEANQLAHPGPHQHSLSSTAFHHCEERCRYCGYYCTLPLSHPQSQHETSHGSMSQTEWIVDGDENVSLELQGRKYATGDSGAPMLCSMLCKTLGRHAHIDRCRLDDVGSCMGGVGVEHVRLGASEVRNQDWITHRLFWARSGFKGHFATTVKIKSADPFTLDPYTNTEQADFDLCEHRCGGEEHDSEINSGALPSYCVLPLFHPPADANDAPGVGHVSVDGHAYQCKNPAQMQRSFHIFFAVDRSGSMTFNDRRPLPNSPATQRIVQRANNRFGAVVSSLYGFWTARDAAIRSGVASGMRRDAYTIIPFSSSASTIIANDTASDPDQLLEIVLRHQSGYEGTNFTHALQTVQREMENTWATERSPVVVFLSDGECGVADEVVYDLCRKAVTLGKPLSLHTVSFGSDTYSRSLRRIAAIAGEVYASAPRDPLAPSGNPCAFSAALDTVQLSDTFMSIATSLKSPRAALSQFGRR